MVEGGGQLGGLQAPDANWEVGICALPRAQKHLGHSRLQDKKNYSCPVCEKSFSEDRLIKSHIKTNHPEVSMNTISEIVGRRVQLKGLIGKRAVKCPYCNFYFMKNGSDLQRHIWAHEGVKPFKCSLCEYATRSKSNLKAHMNRHSTEKTHLCDMCGKKFKSKGTLKSHKLLHTADGESLESGHQMLPDTKEPHSLGNSSSAQFVITPLPKSPSSSVTWSSTLRSR
ncbi:UNVERIFIED_CONTAM: hypothetical protein K2H54_028459 [Gekko kuhli]